MLFNRGYRTAVMSVETCSKAFFAHSRRHGKSPFFSQGAFLQPFGPDYLMSVLPCVNEAENME